MSDPLEHPCGRCGAASYQPCTDRAGHIRHEVHTRRTHTAPSAAIEWLRHVNNASLWRADELAAGLYVTYGSFDPRTGGFVYVGQSGSFARRIAAHLKPRVARPHHRFRPIRAWIWDALAAGSTPGFRVLDVCETEEQSLASEALWVERLAAQGNKLLNRWLEHQSVIQKSCRFGDQREPRAIQSGLRRP